ncbi:Hypothetical Protein SLY_0679 [Strawberry lethal yellows phytoplasma (CPA) str. NZSb11]|uniref:Uncharacterized protein n=1 Tax=Strawberry lethal yellows phytoplasma (CPA) str. NZSb11 TaxID=980422 RepID=R4S1C2_PHYAS|nr:Hypothetical Protein SLY_0679 [Strawberry lethal yellows phytoplasma (CPA) str. NZSb11]
MFHYYSFGMFQTTLDIKKYQTGDVWYKKTCNKDNPTRKENTYQMNFWLASFRK